MSESGEDRLWRILVWVISLLAPLVILHETARSPGTTLPSSLRPPSVLSDQTTNATVMARVWQRWDRGDVSLVDDRVFAPLPNALGTGEYYPLAALVGYPVWKLSRSVPASVNASWYVALVLFPVCLHAFYRRLAGGPGAVIATFVVAWGPSRVNGFGVLSVVATAFVPLALVLALRFLESGRRIDGGAVALCIVGQSATSLYGTAMGAIWAAPALLIAGPGPRGRLGRLATLVLVAAVGLAAGVVLNRPFLHVAEDIGGRVPANRFEAHAADVLSLLHSGLWGGPVRNALEGMVPGFPHGAAAFFPTLTLLFVIALAAAGRTFRSSADRQDSRCSSLPWILLAAVFFVLALGPLIRLGGRPIAPGPYVLLKDVPVLSGMRGLHRYDQWFHVSLGAAATLILGRFRAKGAVTITAALLAVADIWPARVPAVPFPPASGWVARVGSLAPDEIVASYPWGRDAAVQAWIDQLGHGARSMNGFNTYSPEIHELLDANLERFPAPIALTILRELGAGLVVVDERLSRPERVAEFEAIPVPNPELGIRGVERWPPFRVLKLDPLPPAVLWPDSLPPLVFHGAEARVGFPGRPLVFRMGPGTVPVVVEKGAVAYRDALAIPPMSVAPASLSLSRSPPPGSVVRRVGGAEVGRVAP